MRRADVIVVGAGVMGAATAWQLTRAGRDVVLIERFDVGHTHGSSHGASRVFRVSHDDPESVEMATQAVPLWRELEADCGSELLITLGGLDVGQDLSVHASALDAYDVAYQAIDPAEAMRRFPRIALPQDAQVIYQADAGIVLADRVVRSLVDLSLAGGAELRKRTKVTGLRVHDGGAEVLTADGVIRAPVAVITAGAWANDLLSGIGIDLPLTVTRETVAYIPMEDEFELPIVADWAGRPDYSLPDPGRGIKAGAHHTGQEADPDQEGTVDEAIVQRLSAWVTKRFPGQSRGPMRAETCLYTNTPDHRFVLERHGPVVVGSACSGTGFKFVPLIGRRLAELALA